METEQLARYEVKGFGFGGFTVITTTSLLRAEQLVSSLSAHGLRNIIITDLWSEL